ncbi:MAG: NADP-dependent isocitrate dehydrogenase [Bacteroidales bacterium]|nr:NADP-dependent isocitrate dehydrogenase [Bacteroidales bacterium]MDD4176040.1 NADP-dependent isocitrate dehydrogenase [Bacteroidales bacterium]MDD4742676.1 NADP-dependent isocitrate dehydrogenase [Bacteroidales bacterium]
MNNRITIAKGDGIGPEIMDATLRIMQAAGVELEYDFIEIGEKVYHQGHKSGITPESWDLLRRNKIFLKAPITTPQGGGYKSLNVTIRKSLGLFSNVRPCRAYTPYVHSNFPKMDLCIVRENEEDLYAGIEHQQTAEVVQCLKLVSRPGSERIIRYAFEYARAYNRRKVTCMTKDNIMKHTDGLFHQLFDKIALEYPDIISEHRIIDIGAALLAERPEEFDVIVTLNLYGDIISDIAAQVAGSVGLGGSANIGQDFAMFEAIHGSAPDIAGKNIANPSGLLNAAIMMLVHIGETKAAEAIENAWLKTLEDGYHTGDIFQRETSFKKTSTEEFADEIIQRLGQLPLDLTPVKYAAGRSHINIKTSEPVPVTKQLEGVDIFLDWSEPGRNPAVLGKKLKSLTRSPLKLKMITNRGVKVYPDGLPETFCTDHWRCRFVANPGAAKNTEITHNDIITLMTELNERNFDCIKTENLYSIDGQRGYSLGQGE